MGQSHYRDYYYGYLKEMLTWVSQFKHSWTSALRVRNVKMDERYQLWEEDMNDLLRDINEALYMRGEDQEKQDKVERIQLKAGRLYESWLALLENLENSKNQQQNTNATPTQLDHEPHYDVQVPLNPVPIGEHKLPPLPYAYDALEPYIDEEIMRLHHDKHHKGYVEGLNKAEKKMAEARKTGDFDLIKHWEREAAFNGAGHYLHTIFWNVMSPQGGGEPTGLLMNQIRQDFGSYEQFKKHFSEAAKNVEAVGWAILVWSPRSHRLEILQAEKHQNLSQWDVIPILPLDVWEHAYYLQYKNDRGSYVNNWWNVVNWPQAEERFKQAQMVRWQPF